jgi:murein DD-endopeptidase MepM/ murein hydrolase activator NlpD
MFVDRYTNGTAQQVWQGGQYGFVRDIRMLRNGSTVFSRFHEGIDIMPVSRDAKNEPLDSVHSMADGIVVHANSSSRASNYGCYVVVEHATNSGPFFSLYAHLRSVDVTPGQRVLCGDLLGSMGYTGTGIDRRRAHVHVELNMLLSSRFSQWHAKGAYTSPNSQGSFNGQNMVGVDVAGWLQRHWVDARIKLSSFIQESETHWKIVVPNQGAELEIVQRYPWLRKPGAESAAWEISFAASAVPLSVRPVAESVTGVRVAWVKEFAGDHRWVTREMLSGTGSSAKLTKHGAEYVDLVVGQF